MLNLKENAIVLQAKACKKNPRQLKYLTDIIKC